MYTGRVETVLRIGRLYAKLSWADEACSTLWYVKAVFYKYGLRAPGIVVNFILNGSGSLDL
jgi:hypothetical protein